MKSRKIFAGRTGSSYPITRPVGPLKWSFASARIVPVEARTARVFLMTQYSAFAPRNCLRNSVI